MKHLTEIVDQFKNEMQSVIKNEDFYYFATVFLIMIVGSLMALFYVPPSLQSKNFTASDMDKLSKLHLLLPAYQNLSFAITFSLAQTPLEYLDSSNQKIKRNLKTILVVGAAIFAYMAFAYAY